MTIPTNPLSVLRQDPAGAVLGLALPVGELLDSTFEGHSPEPLLWRCASAPAHADWARPRASCEHAGLYPVLLGGARVWRGGTAEAEVWNAELGPEMTTDPDMFDAEPVLREWWGEYVGPLEDDEEEEEEEEEEEDAAERASGIAPFTEQWPGLAGPCEPQAEPDRRAAEVAAALLEERALLHPRMGLVPVTRSADMLAAIGWTGPLNYENDAAPFSAVLRSWEDRFGARVVALTHDVLHLSVAAPPTTMEHALAVAAEHFAFCPDNIWQGHHTRLRDYAAHVVLGRQHWAFWWD